jgi:hypothetical protein
MHKTSLATMAMLPLLGSTALLYSAQSQADFQRTFDTRLNRAQEVVPASGSSQPTPTPSTTPTVTPVPGQTGTGNGGTQTFIPAEIQGFGSGSFVVQFNPGLNRATYLLNLSNVANVTAAHLHCGRAGENGPVVAPLLGNNTRQQNVTGSVRNADIDATADCRSTIGRSINNVASLLAAMNEGLVYVNVHTQQYPDGFIRGQLFPGANWSQLMNGGNSSDNGSTTTPTPSGSGQ